MSYYKTLDIACENPDCRGKYEQVNIAESINLRRSPSLKDEFITYRLNSYRKVSCCNSAVRVPSNMLYHDEGKVAYWHTKMPARGRDVYQKNEIQTAGFMNLLYGFRRQVNTIIEELDTNNIDDNNLRTLANVNLVADREELRERVVMKDARIQPETLFGVKLIKGILQNLENVNNANPPDILPPELISKVYRTNIEDTDTDELDELDKLYSIQNAMFKRIKSKDTARLYQQNIPFLDALPHGVLLNLIDVGRANQKGRFCTVKEEEKIRNNLVSKVCEYLDEVVSKKSQNLADNFLKKYNKDICHTFGFKFKIRGLKPEQFGFFCLILEVVNAIPIDMYKFVSDIMIDAELENAHAYESHVVLGQAALEAYDKTGKPGFEHYVIHEIAHTYMDTGTKFRPNNSTEIKQWLGRQYKFQQFDVFTLQGYIDWIDSLYGNDPALKQLKSEELKPFSRAIVLLAYAAEVSHCKYGTDDANDACFSDVKSIDTCWVTKIISSWENDRPDVTESLKSPASKKQAIAILKNLYNPDLAVLQQTSLLSRKVLLMSTGNWWQNMKNWMQLKTGPSTGLGQALNYKYRFAMHLDLNSIHVPNDEYAFHAVDEYFAEISVDYVRQVIFKQTLKRKLPQVIVDKLNDLYL